MDEQKGRDRLAALVKAERRRRYRTITAAIASAEVSRGTWEKVETGQRVKSFTLDAIEEALGWPPGRAEAILAGEDPQPELPAHVVEGIMASTILTDSQKRELIHQLSEPDPHEPPRPPPARDDSLQGSVKES